MDVLLVAAKKEKIADYTGVITQAGRLPVVVDVDAFALQNAFEANYDVDPSAVDRPDERRRERDEHQHRQRRASLFTRDISIGGNAYTEAVQQRVQPAVRRAPRQTKQGRPVDGATLDEATPVLRAVTENVLLEIQKTFDFFKATAASDRIDRVMLCGGAARVRRLRRRAGGAVRAAGGAVRTRSGGSRSMPPRFGVDADEAAADGRRGRGARAATGRRPMIRINLLQPDAGEAAPPRVGPALAARARRSPSPARLILALAALGIGWWYWSLRQEAGAADRRHQLRPKPRPGACRR